MKKLPLFLCLAAALATLLHAEPAPFHWSVSNRIHLGGEGGWDYLTVDPQAQRLYVSHASHVLVLDLKTNKVIASLDSAGVHGIALARELNHGFFTNGADGTVTLFDLTTLKLIAKLKAGEKPDAICYEPVTKRVLVFNGRSQSASVFDAVTGEKVGDIALPGSPEFAQADNQGAVFVNIEDKSLVLKLDPTKLAVVKQWPLPAESEPSALAIDRERHRLFIGCGSAKMMVMDDTNGGIVATLPIGKGVDADFYDPMSKRAFASCGDGTLTVIEQKSADDYAVEGMVPTERGARTMTFDPTTSTVYLASAKFGPLPPATPDHPKQRPPILPDTFEILVVTPTPGQ
jgi:hypothetical protein